MSISRSAALVFIAVFVPGGLVVIVPAIYRLIAELRNKRRERLGDKINPTIGRSRTWPVAPDKP